MAFTRKDAAALLKAAGRAQRDRQKLRQQALKAKLLKNYMNPKQRQDLAAQRFLTRRALEENPLMQLQIPEEGDTSNQVEYPASRVSQNSKGQMVEKELSDKDRDKLFMTKYEDMIQRGKKPAPFAKALYEKAFNRVNSIRSQKESKASAPNKATQDFLDLISDKMDEGEITNRQQAEDLVQKNGPRLGMRGADVDHIYQKIQQYLPEAPPKKKENETLQKFAQIGKDIWEKVSGGWQRHEPDDEEEEIAGVSGVRG